MSVHEASARGPHSWDYSACNLPLSSVRSYMDEEGVSAASKRYLGLIHMLPCVVCLGCYGRPTPATEAHHIEFVRGEHSDFATVPLCGSCHDEMHEARRRAFYRAHKLDDVKLLAFTARELEKLLWGAGKKAA